MTYADDEKSTAGFGHHMRNIPTVPGEKEGETYLRAFDHLLADATPATVDEDWICEAAKDAIRFIADDAFRRGFESCHQNLVEPLRGSTVARDAAIEAMHRHGEHVRSTIVAKFEEAPGVPNQITVDIDEVELPQPKLVLR
jgi:hypothetical protein